MADQMTLLLSQLGRFLIMILIGFLVMRLKWLNKEDFAALSRLVVKVLMPLYLITTIPAAGTRADLIASLPLIGLALFAVLILLAVGTLTVRLLKMPDLTARSHIVCNAISNIGFMGIPLGAAMFGAPGVLGASMFTIANDAVLWTVGRAIYTRRLNIGLEKPDTSGGDTRPPFTWRSLVNVNIIMVLAGTALLALEINPAGNIAWEVMTGIGNICRFLPMIIIGGMIAALDFRNIRFYLPSLLIVASKMILLPIAVALIISRLFPGLSEINFKMLIIGIALPTFATSAAAAATYGADSTYGAGCTTITTLASLLTLPLVFYLISLFY
jgi:predicted permease